MTALQKIEILFSKINDREQAIQLLKSAAIVIWVYQIINLITSLDFFFNERFVGLLPNIKNNFWLVFFKSFAAGWLVITVLVFLTVQFKNRIAAVLNMMVFTIIVVAAAVNPLLLSSLISFLAVIYHIFAFWCAVRMTEAVFKLNGRFALSKVNGAADAF